MSEGESPLETGRKEVSIRRVTTEKIKWTHEIENSAWLQPSNNKNTDIHMND